MVNTPGIAADIALLLWIPVSLIAFFLLRPTRAALFTIFGGLLFLPEGDYFKLPFVPQLGKAVIPYLCVVLGCAIRARSSVWRPPRERWVALFTLIIIAGGIGTALTNRDIIPARIPAPALTIKDGLALSLAVALQFALPFYLGRALFRTSKDLRGLLRFIAAAGLVYSVLALFEVRMSPQLHADLYGYGAHDDFLQTMRMGGFRPMVFMAHGLAVALFFLVTTLAAAGLGRTNGAVWGMRAGYVAIYLGFVLVLCKSTGAIAYGLALIPIVALAGVKLKNRLAILLAAIVLLYPVLRGADLFPVKGLLSAAAAVAPDREQSLQFRFTNEDLLLARARLRPWFGWGEFGRNYVNDTEGNLVTVTDGAWIIVMGEQGAVGFVSTFGLLVTPIFLTSRRLKYIRNKQDRSLLTTLALMVAITAVDLIPNGFFSNYPYLLSGALLSLSRTLVEEHVPDLEGFELEPGEMAYGA